MAKTGKVFFSFQQEVSEEAAKLLERIIIIYLNIDEHMKAESPTFGKSYLSQLETVCQIICQK